MKKMYKNLLLINAICFTIILNCLSSQKAHAQTTIYSQNFDTTPFGAIPTGWTRTSTDTSAGWGGDTTIANSSVGYTGASGLANCVIKNIAGAGTYTLTTPAISTLNHDSISIIWGERRTTHFPDSGSAVTCAWSTDNINWNAITYVENPNNSTWYLINDSTRIPIPAGAWNKPAVNFQWTAVLHTTPSGTLRIDDFNVMGDSITSGISEINGILNTPSMFLSNNQLNIKMNGFSNEKINFALLSVDGKQVMNSVIEPISQTINLGTFAPGVYIVSMTGNKGTYNYKLFIDK